QSRCSAQLLRWQSNETFAYADAFSDAYGRLSDPVSHRRRVAFINSQYWIIVDDLCGSESHRIDLRFQFAPMKLHLDDDGWVRAARNSERGLLLRVFASAPVEASVRQGGRNPMEGWISSNYGSMEPAPALVYTGEGRLPMRIVTVLWPAEDIQHTPGVDVLRDADGRPSAIETDIEDVVIDDDENAWIVFNGEIYNHPELKRELEGRRHQYRTRSDTETILHIYKDAGEACVGQLRGMFAFALWDRRRQQLLLGRDRLGIKPLYYAVTDHHLLFASEIKAILASGYIYPVLNEKVVPEYLASAF